MINSTKEKKAKALQDLPTRGTTTSSTKVRDLVTELSTTTELKI